MHSARQLFQAPLSSTEAKEQFPPLAFFGYAHHLSVDIHPVDKRCRSGLLFAYGFVVVYATSRTLANNYGYSSLKIGLVTIAYGAGVLNSFHADIFLTITSN